MSRSATQPRRAHREAPGCGVPVPNLPSARAVAEALGLCAFANLALSVPPSAVAFADTPQQCTARWGGVERMHQTGPLTYQTFMAGCLAGRAPPSLPVIDAPAGAPAGATARCRDGSYTATTVSLGACDHHNGVAAIIR